MYTKQKLLLSTVTSLFLATSLFASSNGEYKENRYKQNCKSEYQGCDGKKNKNHHKKRYDKSGYIMGAINSLDLTKEQQLKVNSIIDKFRKDKNRIFDSFTNEGFDKEKYIQARLNKKENMVKARANMIENIYSVLSDDQKAKLKDTLQNYNRSKDRRGKNCQQ